MPPKPNDTRANRRRPGLRAEEVLSGRRILLVENTLSLPAALRGVTGASLTVVPAGAISRALLEKHNPEIVLAPLMTDEFDIFDLARKLGTLGYAGALRAFCAPLPRPALVRAEVRSVCPGLDFDLLEIDPGR